MTTNYQAPAGSPASDCSAFSVGDRVTTVKSDSLPESMEGIPCIVTAVDMATDEEYSRYEVTFRMDHKTPIRMGEDVIATELLDRSNLRLGWSQWRDLGDGEPILVAPCPMCGVCPSAVDDCGQFGNSLCPYFGKDSKQNAKAD